MPRGRRAVGVFQFISRLASKTRNKSSAVVHRSGSLFFMSVAVMKLQTRVSRDRKYRSRFRFTTMRLSMAIRELFSLAMEILLDAFSVLIILISLEKVKPIWTAEKNETYI